MGNTANRQSVSSGAAQVGRPARVSAQDIIAAAIDIGLEGVTLKQVADRLDVAVATLYRHVRDRDELVRLAAFRLAVTRPLPDAADGHWTELAVDYARSLFESFVDEPQLIHELMKGRLGPDMELDFLEQFLAELAQHGIDADEGIRLHRSIAMLTIGAAVGAISARPGGEEAANPSARMRLALATRDADDLPHVRRGLDTYLDMDPEQLVTALNDLLAGFQASHGEVVRAARGGDQTATETSAGQRRRRVS